MNITGCSLNFLSVRNTWPDCSWLISCGNCFKQFRTFWRLDLNYNLCGIHCLVEPYLLGLSVFSPGFPSVIILNPTVNTEDPVETRRIEGAGKAAVGTSKARCFKIPARLSYSGSSSLLVSLHSYRSFFRSFFVFISLFYWPLPFSWSPSSSPWLMLTEVTVRQTLSVISMVSKSHIHVRHWVRSALLICVRTRWKV